MKFKVISGGQVGVDQAALRAAKAKGIETGGWAPRNYLTEDGFAPWLADYGLQECPRVGYPARTLANVRDCDLCVLLYTEREYNSSGTRLTRSACLSHGKEIFEAEFYLVGFADSPGRGNWRPNELRPAALADTIRRLRPGVVLVAGNRESRAPGIGVASEKFLAEVFDLILGEENP